MTGVGVGLVGCGMIGQIHADGLAKLAQDGDLRPVAAADLSSESVAAAARNCPFERTGTDPMAVIHADDVDAVLIATPTLAHRELLLATLAAGKAVLCEKPLAPTFDLVTEMCDAVASSSVVAQVGFHSRFHPLFNALRDLVTSGELGAPMGYVLRDDQYFPSGDFVPGHSSWRHDRAQAGGGALLEHSIHAADILCWLFGPASSVYCRSRNVFGYDVEDTAALAVEHADGVVGTLVTIFNGVTGREQKRLEVFFERGAVELTSDFIVGAEEDSLLIQRPDEPAQHVDLAALRDAHFAKLGIERRDFLFYLYAADRAWVQAVSAGRAASPGFADALAAHALVDAAYRSAAAGEPVTL
jgi:myo-inositol 2-dehydrogenase/D-chiro-inositol 1-dehydrogenase